MRSVRFGSVEVREASDQEVSEHDASEQEEGSEWSDWSEDLELPAPRHAFMVHSGPEAEWSAQGDCPRSPRSPESEPDVAGPSRAAE
eukprot:1566698-Alexandrium_andersonii.AAC.1